MRFIYLLLILITPFFTMSQNVGIGTSPNNSAMLDVSSSSKGLLIPRMTTFNRLNNISVPIPAGLMVYDTDTKSFWFYNGTMWQNMEAGSNQRSIYIPANAMSYNPAASGVTISQWGINLINTASATPGFIIPKPVDWDSTQPFTITLHYSFPTLSANTIISWRILAGSTDLNASAAAAGNGWDSYDFYQSLDAAPAAITGNSSGRTNLAKSQTFAAIYSNTFNTWYVGTGVTTNNDFSHDPLWQFRFQRGNSVSNGEGYTGTLTINGASINYTAK